MQKYKCLVLTLVLRSFAHHLSFIGTHVHGDGIWDMVERSEKREPEWKIMAVSIGGNASLACSVSESVDSNV